MKEREKEGKEDNRNSLHAGLLAYAFLLAYNTLFFLP